MDDFKICSKCNSKKMLNDFYFIKTENRYNNRCKNCVIDSQKTYYHTGSSDKNLQYKIITNNKKICKQCLIQKDLTEFYFFNNRYELKCKTCLNKIQRERPSRKVVIIKYEEKNKETLNKKRAEYRKNNREKCNYRCRRYYQQNKEKVNNRQKKYIKKRRKNDFKFKIECSLRESLIKSIKKKYKKSSALILIGLSVEDFQKYIESKFQKGMTWENWGKGENKWNLDHILPIELFDLTDTNQQKICFHYTNLQPLWQNENELKSDFISNGRKASRLSKEEKLEYLKSKGHNI